MLVFPTAPSPTSMQLSSSRGLFGFSCLWEACAIFPLHYPSRSMQECSCYCKRCLLPQGPAGANKGWRFERTKAPNQMSEPQTLSLFPFEADLHSHSHQEELTTGRGQLIWPAKTYSSSKKYISSWQLLFELNLLWIDPYKWKLADISNITILLWTTNSIIGRAGFKKCCKLCSLELHRMN